MFYKIIVGVIPWEKTDNIHVLTERMKQQISFPQNLAIDKWIKEMISGMIRVDETQRFSIKDVKKILDIKCGSTKMDV